MRTMKNLLWLMLSCAFLISPLHAQVDSNPMILLEYPQVEITNKSFYVDQINKLTIQTIAKHRGYEPVFANETIMKSKLLNRLIIKINKSKESGFFNVEISQNSGKSGNPIRNSWAVNVPERFVLLQTRLSIIESLYGKTLAKEERDYLKKNDISFKEYLDTKEKTAEVEEDSSSDKGLTDKDIIKKKSKLKKKSDKSSDSGAEEVKGRDLITSLDTNIPYNEIKELVFKKPEDFNQIIFKIRKKNLQKEIEEIENLQKAIRTSMAKKISSTKETDAVAAKSDTENNNANQIKNNRDLPISLDSTALNPFNKEVRPRKTRNMVELVYLSRILSTTYLLTVYNKFSFTGPRYTYRRNLSEVSGDDLVFSIMNLRAVGVNDVEYSIPDVRNAHVQYLSSLSFLPFDYFLGMHYENQFFVNLAEINQGLKVAENHLVWVQTGIERVFQIKNIQTVFQAFYAKNIFSKSNFLKNRDVKLDGTRLSVGAEVSWRKWSIGMQYAKDLIESNTLSGFKIDQTSYFMNLAYGF